MATWKDLFSAQPVLEVADLTLVDLDDEKMNRAVVRKQDMHLLPWMCITYLLNYLNRVSLGNARTLNDDNIQDNIMQHLDLTGQRYSVAIAVFFVPYVLMEFPGNVLMRHFSPSRWISRIVTSVGFVTICTASATTYRRLLVARFFLGMAEAGFSSGVMMHLCFWYKPEERAGRMAIFASSVALACAFGGLLASAISFLNGVAGLAGWQWLFILEGAPGMLVGMLVWFLLPDYPQTARWLTPYERAFAIKRLGAYAPTMHDDCWNWKTVKQTVRDPVFWLFAVQYFLMTNSLNAFGYFTPTIISSMGFAGYNGQLLTVPPNIFALLVIVSNCLHSDKTRERSRHIIAALVFVAAGYLVLALVPNWGVRYAAVFVIACTNAAVLPFIAHRTATVTGSMATAVATGGMVAISNCAGLSAPFLFPGRTAPMFSMGNWTIFAFLMLSVLMSLYAWHMLGSHSGYRTEGANTVARSRGEVEKVGDSLDMESAPATPSIGSEETRIVEVKTLEDLEKRDKVREKVREI
ncbi:major facilitator superfamily transporter [Sodiomyces alkalinus F11]|uniref:Major facilitator superfamily transporter n=1 Tax=Sodiomyces alkalinus (strain CBS 110278 / VKM F-3762 / F11) TaxID=1314773 RepID=A0A3N2PVG7_SODAK|nr:major facilitator superfamily transporter [Sodiomyces alkalinus F11]ROT38474.1 major facilitator superfamily transporter [Sodiomyces alkalinus F11]